MKMTPLHSYAMQGCFPLLNPSSLAMYICHAPIRNMILGKPWILYNLLVLVRLTKNNAEMLEADFTKQQVLRTSGDDGDREWFIMLDYTIFLGLLGTFVIFRWEDLKQKQHH